MNRQNSSVVVTSVRASRRQKSSLMNYCTASNTVNTESRFEPTAPGFMTLLWGKTYRDATDSFPTLSLAKHRSVTKSLNSSAIVRCSSLSMTSSLTVYILTMTSWRSTLDVFFGSCACLTPDINVEHFVFPRRLVPKHAKHLYLFVVELQNYVRLDLHRCTSILSHRIGTCAQAYNAMWLTRHSRGQ